MKERCKAHLRYGEFADHPPTGETVIPLVLEVEAPAPTGVERFELRIGRSFAQVRLLAERIPTSTNAADFRLACSVRLRGLSQLWHASQVPDEQQVPVSVIAVARNGPQSVTEAGIDSQELQQLLQSIEAKNNLGVRTKSLDPPIYLEAFWGPREFGVLDAELAKLDQTDILPDSMLRKARQANADNNWAVVVPRDLTNRQEILEALSSLIRFRRGRIFELAHGEDPSVLFEFLQRLYRMPSTERPYYLLLLGDFDDISIEFQYFLQSFGAAGRLCVDDVDGYRTYAEKVIGHEQGNPVESLGPTYIATDLDDVNARNFVEVVEPLSICADLTAPRTILAKGHADKDRVLHALRGVPMRSPVLIFAHGFEHLRTDDLPLNDVLEDMREFQGSLMLDDFELPRLLGSSNGLLCPKDVRTGRICAGGVLLLHACYSAGTIERDTMPEWVHMRMPDRVRPPKPFVSQLARALLANPEGPVAVYGHVNRSHQANYFNPAAENGSYPFRHYQEMLRALSQGLTVGYGRESCRRMTIQYMAQAMTLSYQIEWLLTGRSRGIEAVGWPRKGVEPYERSFLQYSFGTCNFRNYIVLGDPMARLCEPNPEADHETGEQA